MTPPSEPFAAVLESFEVFRGDIVCIGKSSILAITLPGHYDLHYHGGVRLRSTLGTLLSEKLGWPLYEGDDFHPPENIDKMARGEALTDQDRFPWLHKLHQATVKARGSSSDAIVVCSALKRLYRQILLHGSQALTSSSCTEREALPPSLPGVHFLFLNGDYELIHQRMVARSGHYMRADMLQSQFSALEPPGAEERVLTVDIRRDIGDIVTEVVNLLSLRAPS